MPRLDVALFSPPAIPVIGDLMRYTISPLFGRLIWPLLVRRIFYPAVTSARFKQEYPVWMSLRPGQIRASSMETAMLIPSAYRLRKRYHELRMPVVLLAGAGDIHSLPRLHSERLHRELPNSELILVPHAGHMVAHTSPQSIVAAIDRAAAQDAIGASFPYEARQSSRTTGMPTMH